MSEWHTWTRWCSVCNQRYVHVYPDDCEQIECRCGAWVDVPALSVIEGGRS